MRCGSFARSSTRSEVIPSSGSKRSPLPYHSSLNIMGGVASYFRLGHSSAEPQRCGVWLENAASDRTMAAVIFDRHGPADCLRCTDRFPRPVPSRGQLLVQIFAASVNPVDVKLRAYPIPPRILPLPKVTGTDFAGVVVSSDSCTASRLKPGDRVLGSMPLLYSHW